MFIPSGRVEIKWNRMNICRISIAALVEGVALFAIVVCFLAL